MIWGAFCFIQLGSVSPYFNLAQLFLKQSQRSLPSQLSRFGVVAGGGGVVFESVVYAFVHKLLVLHIGGFQRCFIGGGSSINALVECGVVQH